jgi:hypothetical protein
MIYTLIMTLWLRGGGYTPTVTVSEHSSEQACRYAGAQQEVALRNDLRLNTSKYYTFICVPK